MTQGHFVELQCKGDNKYRLAARSDGVVLAPADESDARQQWYKDRSWEHVKDDKGFPCFALINKATRQALTHTGGEKTKVSLSEYFGDSPDRSTLWSLSGDVCGGWNAIRPCHDTNLNVTANHWDKKHSKIVDGTDIYLAKWDKHDNQCWELAPARNSTDGADQFHRALRTENRAIQRSVSHLPRYKICCKAGESYSVSVRSDGIVLAPSDPNDPRQQWIKDDWWGCKFQDSLFKPAFVLLSVASQQALSHAPGEGKLVALSEFKPNVLDEGLLWSCQDVGGSWSAVRPATNVRLGLDAVSADKKHGGPTDGTKIGVHKWKEQDNQQWRFIPID